MPRPMPEAAPVTRAVSPVSNPSAISTSNFFRHLKCLPEHR
jgi:hypothetical protein